MDTNSILKKVRKIEIRTKGLTKDIFSGEYHSAFKGRGMSFSEVKEYNYGDDVRNIDWNVTARTGAPHLKIYEEERELTVMLLIDVSASTLFGTLDQPKNEIITELAAVLAFSAVSNNDKVGAIFFSSKIEKYLPPKKGKQAILRIIRELITIEPLAQGTDLTIAFDYLNNIQKKRSIAFVLSDFEGGDFQTALSIASKRHDITGIKIWDIRERDLPDVGIIQAIDPETNQQQWIDTSDRLVRARYESRFKKSKVRYERTFALAKAGQLKIATDEDYIKSLYKYFKSRSKR